jgi:hypothetical protein
MRSSRADWGCALGSQWRRTESALDHALSVVQGISGFESFLPKFRAHFGYFESGDMGRSVCKVKCAIGLGESANVR